MEITRYTLKGNVVTLSTSMTLAYEINIELIPCIILKMLAHGLQIVLFFCI